jgi:DNA-binding transcriptional LysR family regulator
LRRVIEHEVALKTAVIEKEGPPLLSATGLNLRLIEIFQCVVDQGSMSAAAERLGLTQAAVSQSILALETVLATQLFDRSVRPMALTLSGRRAQNLAREILQRSTELLSAARGDGTARVPLLRIGMLNSFATTAGAFVLDQLRDLADEWTVVSGYRATTMQSLQDRVSDVIITTAESPIPEGIVALPLLSEPFVVAVPSAYRGRTGDLPTLAQKLDFIRYGHDIHMSSTINRYLDSIGAAPGRRYQFDTTDAALHMVSGGFGWTIVSPLILLKSPSLLGAIRIVRLKEPEIRRTFIIAMRRGDSAGIAARIQAACLTALEEVVLPHMRIVIPTLEKTLHLSSRTAT